MAALFCVSMAYAVAAWPPPGTPLPRLLLGPTANHKNIMNETLAFLEGQEGNWSEVRSRLVESGGALHTRRIWSKDTGAQQKLAELLNGLGLELSVEAAETGFCGAGTGESWAASDLDGFASFLAAGGKIRFWEITSSFSRTHRACPTQPLSTTISEAAKYAAAIQKSLPDAKLFLYDALPHYDVGEDWPANEAGYGLELGDVLTRLRAAMAAESVVLHGYWADCPEEYSAQYQHGDGYARLAAAAALVGSMGLEFGKTINTGTGGQTSDKAFYAGTYADFGNITKVLPSASNGTSLSYAMVETWYTYPTMAAPETKPYSTTWTARRVFREIRRPTNE